MDTKMSFSMASNDLSELLMLTLSSIEEKGMDLNIRGLHYLDAIRRAIAFLDSGNEDLRANIEMESFALRLINELEKNTLVKDEVHF